jgi:hypothetical protein
MHGETIKFVNAQQAKLYNIYKNTKLKLLKMNVAICFNKICLDTYLRPNYIGFKIDGHKQQDKKTAANAIRFRINQEVKFQYKRKQHLNQQLYQSHLEYAHHYKGMWQHIQTIIDRHLHYIMENKYQKLNKKLDALSSHGSRHLNKQKAIQFQPKVINLSNTHFTKEQINILSSGPNYAIGKELKKSISMN